VRSFTDSDLPDKDNIIIQINKK